MVGIDKIAITTKNFRVTDIHNGMDITLHKIRSGEQSQAELFAVNGKSIQASKACMNADGWTVDIDYRGLRLFWNPSRREYPNQLHMLMSEPDKILTHFKQIQKEAKNRGILISDEVKINRKDFAKGIDTYLPYIEYRPVIASLVRSKKDIGQYETTQYLRRTKSRETCCYDKVNDIVDKSREKGINPDNVLDKLGLNNRNLLRMEERYLKTNSVKTVFNTDLITEISKMTIGEMEECFIRQLIPIFKPSGKQEEIQFNDNGLYYDLMNDLVSRKERYLTNIVFQQIGIEQMIKDFGSWENIEVFFSNWLNRKKVKHRLNKVREEYNRLMFLKRKNGQTQASLYLELQEKLLTRIA